MAQGLSGLNKYGLAVPTASSEIWDVVLQHAHGHPIRVYAIAAANGIDSVCVAASQYTLGLTIYAISEADAVLMGPRYLRRLVFLHVGRRDALQRIIYPPPDRHTPGQECSSPNQDAVVGSWALAVADILTRPAPHSIQVNALIEVFGPLALGTACQTCQGHLRSRTHDVVQRWMAVRRTV